MDSTLLFFAFLLFSDMSKTCPSFQKALVWGMSEAWAVEVQCSQILAEGMGLTGPAQPCPDIRRTGSHK